VDPLWEFVLEDYDEEDRGRGRKAENRKTKDSSKDGKYFNFFGGVAGQNESTPPKKLNGSENKDDNDITTKKVLNKTHIPPNKSMDSKSSTGSWSFKSKIDSSKSIKQEKRNEYRDDKEDGFWDVITGAPPAATIPKKGIKKKLSNQNGNSRELVLKKSVSGSSMNSSLKRTQPKLSANSQSKAFVTASRKSEKSKNMFKKRFRRNHNTKSPQVISTEKNVSEIDLKRAAPGKPPKNIKTSQDKAFDPMNIFFQIADSLDPWGGDPSVSSYEIDSLDETATIDAEDYGETSIPVGKNVDRSVLPTGSNNSFKSRQNNVKGSNSMDRSSVRARDNKSSNKLESLLDQSLPDPIYMDPKRRPCNVAQSMEEESGVTTEIRLRVNPGGTLSEEVFKKHNNVHGNRQQEEQKLSNLNKNLYSKLRPSFDDSEDSDTSSDMSTSKQSSLFELKQSDAIEEEDSIISRERNRSASNEIRVPMDVHVTKETRCSDDAEGEDSGGAKKCALWNTAICSSEKACKNDSMNRSRKSDAANVFPSSRVIINGEIHSIIGPQSDPFNGVMGVSSKYLTETKGPQSVFAYDYDSNENMDVSYSKANQNPRDSISVRNLGGAPSLSLVGERIVIQVEASSVSETDCIIRQGLWWYGSRPSFPNTPGIDVVGKVYSMEQNVGKAYGLKPMETVVSLIKWGGNTRFMTIHPNQLVKVPHGLDPAQVACLPESYLSAFQVLHMGQRGSLRYRGSSLKGKSVLILGCMTHNMGKAMIELALDAGVANIYATAKKKHWKTLISYGVMPLSSDPMEYIHRISGTIDLVLAPNGNLREDVSPVHFRALLPRNGQLIFSGHRINGNDIPINDWKRDQAPTLACGKNKALQKILGNSTTYDVYNEWEKNLDLCKRDLSHLLKLLELKVIKPEVLDRISLNKVAKAHELIETKRLPGFLVCEPWMKTKKRAVYL